MNENATTIGTWAHAIIRALESYGANGKAICEALKINTQRLSDPNYRIPVSTMTRLWRKSVEVTGDSAFGLRVAEQVSPTTFHALGFASIASRDFQEVAQRIMSNTAVVSEVATVKLLMQQQQIWFCIEIKPGSPQVAHEAIDAFMAALIYMAKKFVGVDIPLIEVFMQRPAPANMAAFQSYFNAPVHFDSELNALVCPISLATQLMPSYNPALVEANEKVLQHYNATQAQSLTQKVMDVIEQLLPDEPLQARVAQQLNMSVRKMQRLLEAENKRYQDILDEFRKKRALALIEEGRTSIKAISYQLGFANQSAFTRAFKRWTGCTPNQMAKRI